MLDEQLCHLSESTDYTTAERINLSPSSLKNENVSQTSTGKAYIHGSEQESM